MINGENSFEFFCDICFEKKRKTKNFMSKKKTTNAMNWKLSFKRNENKKSYKDNLSLIENKTIGFKIDRQN